jgi:lipoate-protein ligase A
MHIWDHSFESPAENLAAEESLLDLAEAGGVGEVLRFWESPVDFIVVGYSNHAAVEVNLPACESAGVPVLRRCSGGGTVVQGPGCLNYSLVLRMGETGPLATISDANRFIMERNRAAMEALTGRSVQVRGHTDLAVDGRKFSGNSQRRRRTHLLFHGTFLLHFNLARIGRLLRTPSVEPDYREKRTHDDFVTNLGIEAGRVKAGLCAVWNAGEPLPCPPMDAIRSLARERYASDDWNRKW